MNTDPLGDHYYKFMAFDHICNVQFPSPHCLQIKMQVMIIPITHEEDPEENGLGEPFLYLAPKSDALHKLIHVQAPE